MKEVNKSVKEILEDMQLIEKCIKSVNDEKQNPWVLRVINLPLKSDMVFMRDS